MRGVLLVGSGAREVAIARKIMGGSSSVRLYCISSVTNPQIETLCHKYFEQSPNNVGGILSVVKNLSIAIAIIGPENPLEAGLVDALEEVGILCVGPRKSVAMIETSKAFARSVLDECAPEKNTERIYFGSWRQKLFTKTWGWVCY
jgi:phosphoribosylamine-glycine ligase